MIPAGFQIIENVLSSRECEALLAQLRDGSLIRSRAGVRELMKCEAVSELASDPRLIQITQRVFGRPLIPYKATLFEKTGKANWLVAWHQDTALPVERFSPREGWSAPSRKAGTLFAQAPASALEKIVALRIHLDDSTETNGPLRVIPGSHCSGLLSEDMIREFLSNSRCVECLVRRGGVVAMSPLLLHASSKITSDKPRRVLHIEYAESLDIDGEISLALS